MSKDIHCRGLPAQLGTVVDEAMHNIRPSALQNVAVIRRRHSASLRRSGAVSRLAVSDDIQCRCVAAQLGPIIY